MTQRSLYMHYNLRLRLKYIKEEVELKYNNSLDNDFVQDDEDLID